MNKKNKENKLTEIYNFNIPKKDKIEIIYYSNIIENDNKILKLLNDFSKLDERKNIYLKIVYNEISKSINNKITKLIKDGVSRVIFKNNLSHKNLCYEIATSDIAISNEDSEIVSEYINYGINIFQNIGCLLDNKFRVSREKLIINNSYKILRNDNAYLFYNIMNDDKKEDKSINNSFWDIFKNIYTIYVNFKHKHEILFDNNNLSNCFKYSFKKTKIMTNKPLKLKLFKNVFYKISCKQQEIRVNLTREKDNIRIFRRCLHNVNSPKDNNDIYFFINNTDSYILNLKCKTNIELDIHNYINLNYICQDNIFMLNLKGKENDFMKQEMILSKFGIKINRFEAINGKDPKYDKIWNNYLNKPFSELEKSLNRRILTRGSIGYLLSMLELFSNNKLDYLCVMDDDVLINKKYNLETISNYFVRLSDFNIIKFGSSQWTFDGINLDIYKDYYIPGLLSNGSFCNIYSKDTYQLIVNEIKKFEQPFDLQPIRQFNDKKSYVIYPNQIICDLDHVSSITNKTRKKDYQRFRWDINKYYILPYLDKSHYMKIQTFNTKEKLHFLIGIISFERIFFLKQCLDSMKDTLCDDYNFTIFIVLGLNIDKEYNSEIESFVDNLFKERKNCNIIIKTTYLHYMYYTSNEILEYSKTIDYDFGFLLNDDILFRKNWHIEYYNSSLKHNIKHLCWLRDTPNTIKDGDLKHNGHVKNANGVLLTFTKDIINNVGLFNTKDFKVRGHAHIEWSYRCCKEGFNNPNTFHDIINSNDLILINTSNYTSALAYSSMLDKVIYFVDYEEAERRNRIIFN